jgi:hypothetical protein
MREHFEGLRAEIERQYRERLEAIDRLEAELLGKESPAVSMRNGKVSTTNEVLSYLKLHPNGDRSSEIALALPHRHASAVSEVLSRLKRQGRLIHNREEKTYCIPPGDVLSEPSANGRAELNEDAVVE